MRGVLAPSALARSIEAASLGTTMAAAFTNAGAVQGRRRARRIGAARVLCGAAIAACQLDSRELVLRPALLPAGEGADNELIVQPSSVAYGAITRDSVASARFLVENAGTTTLGVPAVSLEGDATFILTQNDCTMALEEGAYCGLAVAFRPIDLSPRDATLTITGRGRSFELPLSGSGLEPGGLLLQAAPGSGGLFGDVALQGQREATLELRNLARASSGSIELISNDAAFQLLPAQGSECAPIGAQLASGESCNFRVRFAPLRRGVTDATITARSPGSGSVSLGVSGTGVAPARPLVDPARLDFGDVVVAGAAVLDLAISNVGDGPQPPVGSSVVGEAASAFQISDDGCSAPLPAGETCIVSVSFSPVVPGPQRAVLSLDAGSGGLFRVNLSGAGLAAGDLLVLAADGSDGDFGPVELGSESQRSFRIISTSNEASGPITLAVSSEDFGIDPPSGSECVSGATNLAGGASCDIQVRFAPTRPRQSNATLTVSSMAGGAALNLSGVGLAPAEL